MFTEDEYKTMVKKTGIQNYGRENEYEYKAMIKIRELMQKMVTKTGICCLF